MKDGMIIRLLLVLLGIAVSGFVMLIYLLRRRIRLREAYSIYKEESRGLRPDYLLLLYDFLSNRAITGRFLKNLTLEYKIIYLKDERIIKKKAITLAIKLWIMYILIFIVLLIFNRTWYDLLLTVFYVYVAGSSILRREVEREKRKLLIQFDGFLTEVRQHYQLHGMTDEAIYEAYQNQQKPMKLHGECIYQILIEREEEKNQEEYNRHAPDRFLQTFLALCLIIDTYGDVTTGDQSLFLHNISYLRQEVHMELLKKDKIRHLFSGLVLVAVFPVLFLKVIEDWAVGSLIQLDNFYSGTPGIILTALIFILTFFSYQLLTALRSERSRQAKHSVILTALSKQKRVRRFLDKILAKNYGSTLKKQEFLKLQGESLSVRQFLLKSLLYGTVGFVISIMLFISVHEGNKELQFKVKDMSYSSSAISEEKAEALSEAIISYTKELLKEEVTLEEIQNAIANDGIIKEKYLRRVAAEDIYNRIKTIKGEYFKWYDFVTGILIACGFYHVPYISLLLLKKARVKEMEDEIFSFQSLLLILMHIKRADITAILEWLEEFSCIFKTSLRECTKALAKGEQEALEQLKEKEPFKPFRKIVDGLISSDRIGLEKAFQDIGQDRANYLEKRALEDEISILEKGMLGRTLAFIPFALTVGLYIILPFLVEGINMYKVYMEQLSGKS